MRVGEKWTAHVVRRLEGGARRFTELRKEIPDVTPKVLTETLRAMERDGLVTRTEFDEVPARVEYELTGLGWAVSGLLDQACQWQREHFPLIEAAREASRARTS